MWIRLLGIIVVLALAACAPANGGGRTTEDGRRTTKDEGRTTNVLVTVTPVPTWTVMPLPIATATATITPTSTRTLNPTEALAARLPALGSLTWRAEGDKIVLGNKDLAVLDTTTGGIRWNDFKAIEPYLIKDDLKKQLAEKLTEWKQHGIHFITYPDSRAGFPPYAVTLSTDGTTIALVQDKTNAKDYAWDAKTKTLRAIAPDEKSYRYLDLSTGKFEYDQKAIDEYVSKIAIEFPDPSQTAKVKEAVKWAFTHVPDVTPDQLNELMGVRNGKDFRTYFNETWASRYKIDFDSLVTEFVRQMYPGSYPVSWLKRIRTIDTSYNPFCDMTCVRPLARGSFQIEIINEAISHPLLAPLVQKELFGGNVVLDVYYNKQVRGRGEAGSHASTIAEMLSFALEAYTSKINGYNGGDVSILIDNAWKGGFVLTK